jgi:hypothetical protein
VQSRLLKECIQLMSQTACGLTLIFDLICVMSPAIRLLHVALYLQSLLHTLIHRRFSLLFLLLLPLHLIFPLCPFASFSSTTFQFPYAHLSSVPRRFLLVLCSVPFVICLSIRIRLSAYSLSFVTLIFFIL